MSEPVLDRYRGFYGRFARDIELMRAEEEISHVEAAEASDVSPSGVGGNVAHTRMRQQVMELLDRSDLGERQKQRILAGMTCPCCSGSGTSMILELDTADDGGSPMF